MEFSVQLFHRDLGTLSVPHKAAYDKAKSLGFVEPYAHFDYPKVKYGPEGKNKVVASAEEEAALGEEWHDEAKEGEHFNIA